MSKLSHIEDVEQRNEPRAEEQAVPRAQAPVKGADTGAQASAPTPEELYAEGLPAEADEEFHGLESEQPMGALHKALIAVAVVVVAVAILYIVNSWIHFI